MIFNEWFIGLAIWLLSSGFCIFNPSSSFGKKVIFVSWILGPCRFLVTLIGIFQGSTMLGTIGAIALGYIYGERVMDRLNPNASRIKYILIGFISSVLFSSLIPLIFN